MLCVPTVNLTVDDGGGGSGWVHVAQVLVDMRVHVCATEVILKRVDI